MITYEIPLIKDGNTYEYTQSIDLDGVVHDVRILWNVRRQVWTFSASVGGVPIVTGRPIVLGVDLFLRATSRPRGALVAVGSGDTPGLNELGNSVRLVYAVPE